MWNPWLFSDIFSIVRNAYNAGDCSNMGADSRNTKLTNCVCACTHAAEKVEGRRRMIALIEVSTTETGQREVILAVQMMSMQPCAPHTSYCCTEGRRNTLMYTPAETGVRTPESLRRRYVWRSVLNSRREISQGLGIRWHQIRRRLSLLTTVLRRRHHQLIGTT